VKFPRVLLAMFVSVVAALSFCANAGAANVIVGPSLTSGAWESFECGEPLCISYNTALGGSGPYVTSPVSGAVVGFSIVGGETQGTYKLRSLIPATQSPLLALFRKASAPVAAIPTAGVRSYPTLLPIQAGEGVALVWGGTATLGFAGPAGAAYTEWEPAAEPAENSSAAGESFEELAGFNVEVQPAPTVIGLGTTSGPTTGGTSVTISGADLENATGVSFGSVPAASYTVNSESQITAVAPARESAASVSVTVTTIAGQANAPQQFGYVAPPPPPVVTPAPTLKKTTKPKPVKQCHVPNLKGKKLPSAKAKLKKADCKAGKLTMLKGATPKTGKVVTQGRKAGAKATAGAKVNLTLKP
jgi:hypothetical protein